MRRGQFFPAGEGSPDFNVVHAIRVSNDGMVYLADRENRRVQMFTSDGKFVKQLVRTATSFARDFAFSPDPEQQFLYVGGGKGITIVDRKTLEVLGEVLVPGQIGAGHHIATDSKGSIYIVQVSLEIVERHCSCLAMLPPDSRHAPCSPPCVLRAQ